MFPLPNAGLPEASVVVDGNLRLLGGVVILALIAAYALLLWAKGISRTRIVECPDRGRRARVVFRFADDGTPVDVEACSLRPTRFGCSMRCLDAA